MDQVKTPQIVIQEFEEKIKENPAYGKNYYDLCCYLHYSAVDYKAAIEVGKRFLAVDPLNDWSHPRMAEGYEALKEYETALTYYRLNIETERRTTGIASKWTYQGMARCLSKLGRVEEAKETFSSYEKAEQPVERLKQAIERDPEDFLLLYRLSVTYYELNRHTEALAVLDKYFKLDPDPLFQAYDRVGLSHQALGNYDKAIEAFEQSRNKTKDPWSRNRLAECYKSLQKFPQAIDFYKESIALSGGEGLDNIIECYEQIYTIYANKNNEKEAKLTKFKLDYLNSLREIKDELETIKLEKESETFAAREQEALSKTIEKVTSIDPATAVASSDLDVYKEIIDTKKAVKAIEDDPVLYGYYSGFKYTLSQCYVTSTVVNSGQLAVNTDNLAVSIVSNLIAFAPLCGEVLSQITKIAANVTIEATIKKSATNVTKLAPSVGELEALIVDLVVEVIKHHEADLRNASQEEEKVEGLFGTLKAFCVSAKEKIEDTIWGTRFSTPQEKLGNHDASELIAKFVANGKMYKDHPGSHLLPPAKRKEILLKFSAELNNSRWQVKVTEGHDLANVSSNGIELSTVPSTSPLNNQQASLAEKQAAQKDQSSSCCCVVL